MTSQNKITVTQEMMDSLRTNGAFTSATISALGLNWKGLKRGWVSRMVGSKISEDSFRLAKAGVGVMSKEFKAIKKAKASHPPLAEWVAVSDVGLPEACILVEKYLRMISPECQVLVTKSGIEIATMTWDKSNSADTLHTCIRQSLPPTK